MSESLTGQCLCGAVAYDTGGPPLRVMVCHCRFCQKATGSAFMVDVLVDRAAFRVSHGSPRSWDHRSEGSGETVTGHFCEVCGTRLFLTFGRMPHLVGVYAGTLDDPSRIDRGPGAVRHIFTASAPRGTWLPAGSLVNEGDPAEGPPLRLEYPLAL